ncbi:family 16 glycosylhydrolase [Nocardioides gilvus]|uniref:family 16 glycosylhydrolase n=1 Tax=Nocardioides gilvus TaxID=1735589 RepID=UPI000D74A8D7|nr:family 16 glycosylhydrolase [Nocardioides gilvus]
MRGRRITAIAATILISAGVLQACSTGSESTETTKTSDNTAAIATVSASTVIAKRAQKIKGAKKASKVTATVLPQISQPGKKATSPTSAKAVVSVSVAPRRRTVVTLQAKSGKKWKNVAAAATAKNGKHVFKASAKRGGKAATYRVKVGGRVSKSASTAKWLKPTFSETFSGRKLSSKWIHRGGTYNPEGLRVCSRGSAKAVKVSGGAVRLSVIKDKSKGKKKCTARRGGKSIGKYDYRLNGHIGTENKFSFKYGVAAARIKFPKDRGQHGAFWLQPQTRVANSVNPRLTGAEIDIIESFGQASGPKGALGLTSFTYHWKNRGGKPVPVKTGNWLKNTNQLLNGKKDSWSSGYHVFSVEWTPTEYIMRIDGQETWRSKAGVSGQPQYAILSLLSSDYELKSLGGDKKLPQHMHVDWMRVWETGK